jgi:hypothetical protein
MSWQPLGEFQLIPQWQYSPPTDAVVFRIRQTNFDRFNKAFIAQKGSDGEYYNISAIFPSFEPQILYYPRPPLASFDPRVLAVRAKDYRLTNWTLQLDYMPLSFTDGSSLGREPASTAGTTTAVAASITSVSLVAANTNRKGLNIFNSSTAKLYINYGATATVAGAALVIDANQLWECPEEYLGQVSGIWAAANGNARVTEFS